MGSLSIWHWLIVLLVVLLIFGTKKLRNIGGDVGGAVKGFKDAMNEGKAAADTENKSQATVAANLEETQLIATKAVEAPVAKAPAKKKAASTKKTTATKTSSAKAGATKTTATKPAATKPKATVKKTATAKPKSAAKESES